MYEESGEIRGFIGMDAEYIAGILRLDSQKADLQLDINVIFFINQNKLASIFPAFSQILSVFI